MQFPSYSPFTLQYIQKDTKIYEAQVTKSATIAVFIRPLS